MNVVESADQRDKVKRLILGPLLARGNPPKGWTEDAMFEDYLSALGEFPEPTLAAAAKSVREAHTRASWPFASEYRAACKALGGDVGNVPKDEGLDRSRQAWGYVYRRLYEGNAFHNATKAGCLDTLRQWMFDQACDQIHEGRDPHITDAEIDAEISRGMKEAAA